MNIVIMAGRLTKDPELTTVNTASGPKSKCTFSLAVPRDYKNAQGEYESDFIRATAWGKTAEVICKYLKKGYPAVVHGSWRTGSYTDSNNQKVYTNDLMVNHFEFAIQNPKTNNIAANPYAQPGVAIVPPQVQPQVPYPSYQFQAAPQPGYNPQAMMNAVTEF